MTENQDFVKSKVGEYYKTSYLSEKNKTQASASCVLTKSSQSYIRKLQGKIHPDLLSKNFGCGATIPGGDLSGSTVLDLGSGSGRDCFVISPLVGDTGKVVGIDMTDEAVDMANKYKEYHQKAYGLKNDVVEFRKGVIEDLKVAKIEDNSVDLVVSNCVVNLSPDKEKVFREVWRVLKPGGEMYFSDVYASVRVPKVLREDKNMWSQCVSGALYFNDFVHLMRRIGFRVMIVDAKVVFNGVSQRVEEKLKSTDPKMMEELRRINPKFYSLTIRAFKIDGRELEEEDEFYGQMVCFNGDKNGMEEFVYDHELTFEKGKFVPVSSNIYTNLQKSKYAKSFDFIQTSNEHKGRFKRKSMWSVLEVAESEYDGKNLFSTNDCCSGEGEEKKSSCCD